MLRIKKLRESRGLNMREVAKQLKIPYTTYVNYEKEQREPTYEILILLADFFDVTIDYLLGRTNEVNNVNIKSATNSEQALTPQENSLIQKFRCLDDRGKSAVMNVLNYEYDSLLRENAHPAPKEA